MLGELFGEDDPNIPRTFKDEQRYFITGDQGPVGTISTRPGKGYGSVHWVGVDPKHRRKGVAKAALSYALRQLGSTYKNAILSTSKDNPARKLYERFGFQSYTPETAMGDLAAPAMREFDDVDATRDMLFSNVQRALEEKFPLTNQRYTLKLSDVKYQKPKRFTNSEQKRAIMRGQTLGWKLMGKWDLVDNATGKSVDKTASRLIAQVPYLTNRGTFIFNGTEYTVASQMRLRPGIYSRVKDNGIIEAHFNVKGGTGRSFRVYMEPETGVFRMNVGQANLKLYPILRAMGVDDRKLKSMWGPDLLQANVAASDPRAVQRAYHKLVHRRASDDDPEEKQDTDALKKAAQLIGYGKQPKSDVNYVMSGFFQQCQRCAHFNGLNACARVQGFVAPTGWCVLHETRGFKFAKEGKECFPRAAVEAIINKLKLVQGHYEHLPAHDPTHFWNEDAEGNITDPTISQYKPGGEYTKEREVDPFLNLDYLMNDPVWETLDEGVKERILAAADEAEAAGKTVKRAQDELEDILYGLQNFSELRPSDERIEATEASDNPTLQEMASIWKSGHGVLSKPERIAALTEVLSAMTKGAQDEEGNRRRARFVGELVCDDSKAGKEWAYLKVHKGLPSAAYEALKDQGVDCEAEHDLPHISVLRNWEAKQLIEKYGRKWKSACGHGRKFPFSLQNAIVDLDPEGWKEMDRVWFLEAKSPELRAHRKSLGLEELPRGDDSGKEFQFHITVAVRRKHAPRGVSKISAIFDDVEEHTKQAFTTLCAAIEEVCADNLIKSAMATKLAEIIDMSWPAEEALENESPMDMMERQTQADVDLKGNPAAEMQNVKQDARILRKERTVKKRMTTLEELKAMLRPGVAKQAYALFVGRDEMEKHAADEDYGAQMRAVFEAMEVDPETTEMTLKKGVRNLSPEVITDVTRRLIEINKGAADTDDRDSLAFQRIFGPEDLFAERIARDAGGMSRKLLWRATNKANVSKFPAGALSPQLRLVLLKSGLAAPLEEVNPMEIFDQLVRVTRMGEGGMPGLDAVPDEARSVQPSHFGVIDPIRAPEGMKIGVDSRMTHRTYKGSDGNIYVDMLDARSGKRKRISASEMAKSVVAFPGEMKSKSKEVRAMIRGKKLAYVKRKEVDYELPHTSQMFTATSNMVPLVSATKGGRLLMGAKMSTQALPLRNAEAPLVQNLADDEDGRSFEEIYGDRAGAVRAEGMGRVTDISKDGITVKYADGEKAVYDLYDHFPFNRKTYLHNTPVVKIGDMVEPGQLLAKSNFTDDTGAVAGGLNMKVAYLPYRGYNADDALVISESAAQKLASEHMYTTKFEREDTKEAGKNSFISIYPGTFNKQQLANIGPNGVVKVGTKVNHGDPLVLAISKRKPTGGGMLRARKTLYSDATETWDHESEGVVTDVDKTKDGYKVIVKAYSPMHVGDKLSNRYGGKGVVSKILPDAQMIHDKDGKPFDITMSPLGIVSRMNPSQLVEVALGKIAKKTGKHYRIPGFMDESYVDYVRKELQKHGESDTEDLHDPVSGRKIPKVFTGYTYMMKLHHMAEPKLSGRDVGSYTAEGMPAGGGVEGSKRIGMGEMMALISHGATDVIRDAKLVRGQRNDDFWRALRLGYTPSSPKVPQVYEKFLGMLQASGINLRKQGERLHLFAMTDKDVEKMSAGPVKKAETVSGDKLEPVPGGLFDVGRTGGHGGTRWSHIDLAVPIPNPVMEEPIRRMLGLTQNKLERIIAGKEEIYGETGSDAILNALKRIKTDDSIEHYTAQVKEATGAKRDNAVKVLGYLRSLKEAGQSPKDLMLTKVPVLPPNFRPITSFNKMTMVNDANYLYTDLMGVNDDLNELKKDLGDAQLGDERLRLYKAYKAITGLGDPVAAKTQEKDVSGLLRTIFGSSPKLGMYQRKVLGAAVDTVGRGVITPNPSLGMDQVGLPEAKAWVLYRPFIMRNLVRRGMKAMAAAKAVEEQTPVAYKALLEETSRRPVIINRAPVLHRYGMMAAWPVLTKGNTLQVPPIITSGFNADFDGDAMNFHVPVSKTAVEEAVDKMMPSRNLRSIRDFDIHYSPKQEFLHGLFLASTTKGKRTKTFMKKEDVLRAYRRGELGVGDVVQFGK
jgi:DNA-directed RNA polymerase subunit beta